MRSAATFDQEAADFLSRSKTSGDTWTWVEVYTYLQSKRSLSKFTTLFSQPTSARGFLKKLIHLQTYNKETLQSYEDDIVEAEDIDTASLPVNQMAETILEFHVVYAPTWNSPVLYFTGWTQSGSPLPLASIQNLFQQNLARLRTEYDIPVISQQVSPAPMERTLSTRTARFTVFFDTEMLLLCAGPSNTIDTILLYSSMSYRSYHERDNGQY